MGVFKDAWMMKGKAEKAMQDMGRNINKTLNTKGASGLTPMQAVGTVVQAVAHIPAAVFSSPGLSKKKKK